jgi:type IV pilus assembly protein PilA
MLQKLRQRMAHGEEGFTLVELLVVMLILGLLAAIAIPSFFNQRDKARDADSKADARTAQTAIETYATDNGGSYAGVAADGSTLVDIEETLGAADLAVVSAADTYTVTVTSATGNDFSISRLADGSTTLTCDVDGEAGCPSDGNWGD